MRTLAGVASFILAATLAANGQMFAQPSAQSSALAQKGSLVSSVPADVVKQLTPTGTLRAAINLGNPVLAQGTADAPRGITVDLARELAKRLGAQLTLVPFPSAGKVFEALKAETWDVAFLAVEPVRAAEITFTAPYVLIEGVYMVRKDSPLQSVGDVDAQGVRISVRPGSAYDLFLTRTLKAATLMRSDDHIASFVNDKLEAAAGVRQPMVGYANAHPDVRVVDGRFMEIQQAMGTPQGRPAAAAYLKTFVEEMKASGFVADALKRSNQPDAAVALSAGG